MVANAPLRLDELCANNGRDPALVPPTTSLMRAAPSLARYLLARYSLLRFGLAFLVARSTLGILSDHQVVGVWASSVVTGAGMLLLSWFFAEVRDATAHIS